MSIRLADNTVLPDIPAGYEDYPYRLVFAYLTSENIIYDLVLSKNEPCLISSELSGDTSNLLRVPTGGRVDFILLDINEGWGNGTTSDSKLNITLASNQSVTIQVEWSDFDIKYASSVGTDGVPVIGTEVYFEKGVRDTTPWPEVSNELLEGTPYGVIVSGGSYYILLVAQAPGFVSTFENNEAMFCVPTGTVKMYVWATSLTEWALEDEMTLPGAEVMGSVSEISLAWSNYDILYAASKNDDGTYVMSTDIYFAKNDFEVTYAEEYRVETNWLRSLGDEIRRLTGSKANFTLDSIKANLGNMANNAISNCRTMSSYNTEISYFSFYSTSEIMPVSFPGCIQHMIKKLELPNVLTIPSVIQNGPFDVDKTEIRLNELILNSCTSIEIGAFSGQPLTRIIAPKLTYLNSVFNGCRSLTEITRDFFPEVTETAYQGFLYCENLVRADFPKLANIGTATFDECASLKALVLRKSDAKCEKQGIGYWSRCPIVNGKGVVIVPSALIADYSADTAWTRENNFDASKQFIAIEDYSVDGTLNGDIDWDRVDAYIATL